MFIIYLYGTRIHDNSFRQWSLMYLKFKKCVENKQKINKKLELNSTDYGKSCFQKNIGSHATLSPFVTSRLYLLTAIYVKTLFRIILKKSPGRRLPECFKLNFLNLCH